MATLRLENRLYSVFLDGLLARAFDGFQTALDDLKAAKDGSDPEAIREKTNTLAQASMKLGEAMYAAQQGSGEAAAAEQPADDGVVDAEFEEVSDTDEKKSA